MTTQISTLCNRKIFPELLRITLGAALLSVCGHTGEAVEADNLNYFASGKYIYRIGSVADEEAWLVGVKPGAVLEGEVTIPGSVTIDEVKYTVVSIGLPPVDSPADLASLPWYGYEAAFRDMNGITKVNIPSTIRCINTGEFIGCDAIAEFHVNPANKLLKDRDGVLFIRSNAWWGETYVWNLFRMPPASKKIRYTIPDGTNMIKANAFAGNKNIKTIAVNGNVSFEPLWSDYNLGIQEIDVSGSEYLDNLGGVIYTCEGAQYNGEVLGKYSRIEACPPALVIDKLKLPSSVRYVDAGAFACTSIAEISSSAGIKDIGELAFYKSRIRKLTIDVDAIEEPVYSMLHMCMDCKELESVELKGSSGKRLALNYNIFRGCDRLSSFIAASRNIELAGYAFYGCSSLTSFPFAQLASIPRRTSSDSHHFAYSGLLTARIPSFCHNVLPAMFKGSALKSVNLNPSGKDNTEYIHPEAFMDCHLTEVDFSRTGNSPVVYLRSLDLYHDSFAGNPLKKVVFPAGTFFGNSNVRSVQIDRAFTPTDETWFYIRDNNFDWAARLNAQDVSIPMDMGMATLVCSDYRCEYIPATFGTLYAPAGSRAELTRRIGSLPGAVREIFTMNGVPGRMAVIIAPSAESPDLTFAVKSVEIDGVAATRSGDTWSIPGSGNVVSTVRTLTYTVNGVEMKTVYPANVDAGVEDVGAETPSREITAIYRMDGACVGSEASRLSAGIYLLVYSDGTTSKIIK